jgi:DNA modification methylase
MLNDQTQPSFLVHKKLSYQENGPVECLGMTFDTDGDRRNHFLGELREKLQDPTFRQIEGFPLGTDEDILRLSDPPYYTACPNPWITDLVNMWGSLKETEPNDKLYHREPFATDVTEGKHDLIYRAHPFHTKAPHKAIMRYILHYTEPGDIVFDGFAGTGMTGVAAQLCAIKDEVISLGYHVEEDGTVLREETDESGNHVWAPFSRLGSRKIILNDLSPTASVISHCYTTSINVGNFEEKANRILKETEAECEWLFQTTHSNGQTGKIFYVIWSDVFACPECAQEVIFWNSAIEQSTQKILPEFLCPHCSSTLTKRNMGRIWMTKWDSSIGSTIKQTKLVPVLINYSVGTKRFDKSPDDLDIALIEKIENSDIPYWFPTDSIKKGDKTGEPLRIGITHVHHFYTKRNLWFFSAFLSKALAERLPMFVFTGPIYSANKMYRWTPNYEGGGPLSGTLFVPSIIRDISAPSAIGRFVSKLPSVLRKIELFDKKNCVNGCASLTDMSQIPEESVDYCFIDPPFGGNLMYSELNFLWEAWLKVFTNNKTEAIENKVQGKGLIEYQQLMTRCFEEYYRVLKPGRWMTVEFHNSRNSVWNAIQEALQHAGFVIADVRTLDKQQGSFNQVTTGGAVKQDLIISAYKPTDVLVERFNLEAGTEEGVWDFTRTHMRQLPVFVGKDDKVEIIAERQNYLLYDRMVAFHVQRGVTIPLSASDFYQGLEQRFSERDGMYFLPEQVAEYDKKRISVKEVLQLQLFVIDESSSIQWLKQQLVQKPQTFQELHPQFIKEIGGWQKHEKPLELMEILEQNFLKYDAEGDVPNQIHSYLSTNYKDLRNLSKDDPFLRAKGKDRWYVPDPNKAGDLEQLRERALLREFGEYRQSSQKKLKIFRLEAVRVGFKKSWTERDYVTIIEVADKIPDIILQEDPKLLMWYDQALTRTGDINIQNTML